MGPCEQRALGVKHADSLSQFSTRIQWFVSDGSPGKNRTQDCAQRSEKTSGVRTVLVDRGERWGGGRTATRIFWDEASATMRVRTCVGVGILWLGVS